MNLITEIGQYIKKKDYDFYYDQKVIIGGIHSLKRLNKEKLKIIAKASIIIQKDNEKYASNKDRTINRIGLVLAGSIIIDKFYENIKDLTEEEFIVLSYFCTSQDLNEFEEDIKLLNKSILCAICNKYDKYYQREMMLSIIYNEIKKNNLQENEEIVSYIEEFDEKELDNKYFEYINEGAVKITNQMN